LVKILRHRRKVMKTGVIVYVLGRGEHGFNESSSWEFLGDLDLEADKIEIVISGEGKFDVMDAWWKLTAKGMNRIVCVLAEITNDSRLRLTGRELRLCG